MQITLIRILGKHFTLDIVCLPLCVCTCLNYISGISAISLYGENASFAYNGFISFACIVSLIAVYIR